MIKLIIHAFKCFWIGAVVGLVIRTVFKEDSSLTGHLIIAITAVTEHIILDNLIKSEVVTTDDEKGEEK